MRPTERPPLLVVALLVIGPGLALLYLLVRVFDVPSDTLWLWSDLDDEGSVATWFSTVQLLIPALLLMPVALTDLERKERHAPALLTLALAFVGLSADESIGFHEWIGIQTDALLPDGDRRSTFFRSTGVWMFLLGVPFAVLLGLLLRRVRSALRGVTGVLPLVTLGAAIWLGGALGIELLNNVVQDGTAYAVTQVFFEEVAEMVGVAVMAWGFHRLLMGRGFRWGLGRAAPRKPAASEVTPMGPASRP